MSTESATPAATTVCLTEGPVAHEQPPAPVQHVPVVDHHDDEEEKGDGRPVLPDKPVSSGALDIAFCCDCTGSMGAYIRSAQDNIRAIVSTLHAKKAGACDVRFALVSYRDHPPQDRTYVTTVFPFTRQVEVMQANVDTMSAQGGGDGPEAVAAALKEVSELEWGANASKVVVWIADAPPHGLGEQGDGFPNGCPQGNDPIKVLREMAGRGITLYALGVEPVLSTNYKYARDFMIAAAETMEGKFLPLGQAGALADVIVGTALEGLELEQLWQETEAVVQREAAARGERLTEDDLLGRLEGRMKEVAAKRVVQQVAVENPYMDGRYDRSNVDALFGGDDLAQCRAKLEPSRNAHVKAETQAYAWHAQKASVAEAVATPQQVQRAVGRGKKAHGHHSP